MFPIIPVRLEPYDWYQATWRQLDPLPQVPALPLNRERIFKQWDERKQRFTLQTLVLPSVMTHQEAHFWLQVFINKGQEDPTNLEHYTGSLPFGEIQKSSHYLAPYAQSVIPLFTLYSMAELIPLFCSIQYASWVDGFQRYILPYLTHTELEQARRIVRTSLPSYPWLHNSAYAKHLPCLRLAALLGLSAEIEHELNQWTNKLFHKKPYPVPPSNEHNLALYLIFGLDSADKVIYHMERLGLLLYQPQSARAWIAHTELSRLDYIRDSVVKIPRMPTAKALTELLASVETPEVAQYMVEIACKSLHGAPVAQGWLKAHSDQVRAGLPILLKRRGKVAQMAADYLNILPPLGNTLSASHQGYLPSLDETTTPAWLADLMKSKSRLQIPEWLDVADLPPLAIDGCRLNTQQIEQVIKALKASTYHTAHPLLLALQQHLPTTMRDEFIYALLNLCRYKDNFEPRNSWILQAWRWLASELLLMELAQMAVTWANNKQPRWFREAVYCLLGSKNPVALAQVYQFTQGLKRNAQRRSALKAFQKFAAEQGQTIEQIVDGAAPVHLQPELDYGKRQFQVICSHDLHLVVKDQHGTLRAEPPAPAKSDDPVQAAQALKVWRMLKKQIELGQQVQGFHLEIAMRDARRWSVEQFSTLFLQQPFMQRFIQGLIWGIFDLDGRCVSSFRVSQELQLADAQDYAFNLPTEAQVGLLHPLHVSPQERLAWIDLLNDYQIFPPFQQMGREVYTWSQDATPFQDHSTTWKEFRPFLERHGWVSGGFLPKERLNSYERRSWRQDVITALFQSHYDERAITLHTLKISTQEADPIFISEVMRDLHQLFNISYKPIR